MTSELFTTVDSKEIAVGSADMWPYDFSPAINEGDTIATASATLERTNAATSGLIIGFVTSAVVDGLNVNVTWSAAVLIAGAQYMLRIQANLTGGTVKVVLYTAIEAV